MSNRLELISVAATEGLAAREVHRNGNGKGTLIKGNLKHSEISLRDRRRCHNKIGDACTEEYDTGKNYNFPFCKKGSHTENHKHKIYNSSIG